MNIPQILSRIVQNLPPESNPWDRTQRRVNDLLNFNDLNDDEINAIRDYFSHLDSAQDGSPTQLQDDDTQNASDSQPLSDDSDAEEDSDFEIIEEDSTSPSQNNPNASQLPAQYLNTDNVSPSTRELIYELYETTTLSECSTFREQIRILVDMLHNW
jgi:hypothetical protein